MIIVYPSAVDFTSDVSIAVVVLVLVLLLVLHRLSSTTAVVTRERES